MKLFYRHAIKCALSASFFLGGSYSAAGVHPLAQRVIKIINTEGQLALCKKGGIFRESVGLTPGKNCENHDFAKFAYTACGQVPEFKDSHCFNNMKKMLGGASILGAPQAIETEVRLGASTNTYHMVCTTKREKLVGILKAIADRSCDRKSTNTVTSSLTMVQKQKFQAIIKEKLQMVEAMKIWVPAKPSPKALESAGKVTAGAHRGVLKLSEPVTHAITSKTLLEAAQSLSNKLKNLYNILDKFDPQKETRIASSFEKLSQVSLTKELPLEEMQKRLQIMEQLLNDIN